jgi:hypothetical protein
VLLISAPTVLIAERRLEQCGLHSAFETLWVTRVNFTKMGYAFPLYGRKRRLSEQIGTLYFGLGAAEDRNRLVCAIIVLTASVRLMANALTVEGSASPSLLLRSLAR